MELLNKEYTLVTLDFETFYGKGYSLSRQDTNTISYVADDRFKVHGVGVKIDDEPVQWFPHSDLDEFRELLDELRTEPTALLCHNTAFDAYILHHHFDWHPDFYLDTMSMSRGMFVGAPANLKALSKRLWPAESKKRKGEELALTQNIYDLPASLEEVLGRYCEQDVTLCYEAFKVMLPYFPDDEVYLIHANIRMFAEPWFDVDTQLIQEEIDEQVATKREKFKASGLPKAVLSSNQQFGIFLETQGFDLPSKENPKGELIPALGQKDWPYLKFIAAHPELKHVWEGRKYAKSAIQESRARWFLAVAERTGGQMPVPLNYYGAHTGRYSGGEKLNLQNLPRLVKGDPYSGRLRRGLCAPSGTQVIVSDLSNIEARVLAYVAGQEYLLEMYREGGDPYLFMASKIYDFDYAETMEIRREPTKERPDVHPNHDPDFRKPQRNVGKVAVLGLGFGMGANKFWVTMNTGPMGMKPIDMSFEQAAVIVDTYRETNYAVVDYWRKCDAMIPDMLQGTEGITFGPLDLIQTNLVMPNGMALQYPNLRMVPDAQGQSFQYSPELKENGELKTRKYLWGGTLTENIVQALARIVITEQMIKIEKYLDETYGLDVARTVHMVHDELIVIGPTRYAQNIYDKMAEIMSTPPEWAPDLPLECEGGFAQNYIK